MSICFASICPHPPSTLPSVGSESDIKRSSKTIKSMKELGKILHSSKPDTIVIISPHIPVDFTSFSIIESPLLKGHLYKFGNFKTEMKFKNDSGLVSAIKKVCAGERIPLRSFNDPEMDYGTIVPLHFLSENLPSIKVVPIGFSGLSVKEHLNFGKCISKAIGDSGLRVAVVASGDLSHRLTPSAPAGYSPKGKEFDLKIVEFLKKGNVNGILDMDQGVVEESGECGYRSMTVLFGVLEGIPWKSEVLSYESPFGIGYLVANLKL